MGKPPFFLRVGRTSVRYMASYVHCVRIVYLVRRCHSALRVRVILSHGGEGRESLAGPLVGFQYISCRLVFSSRSASCFSSRAASRCASRLLRLVVRPALCLVLPSRFMSVAFRRECLVLLRFAHRVSHRGRFSSRSFRLVSRLPPRLVSHFVPSCRVAFVAGGGSVWDVGGGDGVLSSSCDVVAVASCFPCSGWLGGGRSIGLHRFIQLVLVRICGLWVSGSWQDGIDMR